MSIDARGDDVFYFVVGVAGGRVGRRRGWDEPRRGNVEDSVRRQNRKIYILFVSALLENDAFLSYETPLFLTRNIMFHAVCVF